MSANPGILPSWRSPVLLEICVISLLSKLYKLLTITQVYYYKSVNLLHTYLSISGLPVQVQYMSQESFFASCVLFYDTMCTSQTQSYPSQKCL